MASLCFYLEPHSCSSPPPRPSMAFFLFFQSHLPVSQFHPTKGHAHVFHSIQRTEDPAVIGKHFPNPFLFYNVMLWGFWATSLSYRVVSCTDQRASHVSIISFPVSTLSLQYMLSNTSSDTLKIPRGSLLLYNSLVQSQVARTGNCCPW